LQSSKKGKCLKLKRPLELQWNNKQVRRRYEFLKRISQGKREKLRKQENKLKEKDLRLRKLREKDKG
jgi:hypothetical protein